MGSCFSKQTKKVTVIMLGLDNAGKTTTAKGLVGESPEDVAPTLGFSSFQLKQQNFAVTIYDLGGSNCIRGIWRNYLAEAFGFIFVIDASAANRVQECREVLHTLLKNPVVSGKPFLILANKHDVDGALDEVEICGLLDIEAIVNEVKSRTRVESCSAIRTNSKKPDKRILGGFLWLLTIISADYINLKQKVDQDVLIQKEHEAKERQERDERVRKLREEREKCEPDVEATPEPPDIKENPFKPVTILVKELENQAANCITAAENHDMSYAEVTQSESMSETENLEVKHISTEPSVNINHSEVNKMKPNSASQSMRSASELIHNTPFDMENEFISSPPSFSSDTVTPPGSVEVPIEHLPKWSPISRQSTLDNDDDGGGNSLVICNGTSSPTQYNDKSGIDSIELEKTAKSRKKKIFSRHNKTAPIPGDQSPLPQREELPPLILKSGSAMPWINPTTPSIQRDTELDVLQLNSDFKMKWGLAEELEVNESK